MNEKTRYNTSAGLLAACRALSRALDSQSDRTLELTHMSEYIYRFDDMSEYIYRFDDMSEYIYRFDDMSEYE